MAETSFASLNPSLLARKGGAKPAMRPQIAPLSALPSNAKDGDEDDARRHAAPERLEDLGWNDYGDPYPDVPYPDGAVGPAKGAQVVAINPDSSNQTQADKIVSEARRQQGELAERIVNQPTKPPARTKSASKPRRSAFSQGKRAAFTLRLDKERHLKLRLATTIRGQSAQQLLTEALDNMLTDIDDLDGVAKKLKTG